MTSRRRVALLPVVVLAAACGDEASTRGGEPGVRDSAGVVIVEFDVDTTMLPHWSTQDSPRVVIGALDGPQAYLLENVRGAHRLGDGRIVIADDGAKEVRFYDAGGMHIRSVGGQGAGPGEFEGILASFTGPGDSILAWDHIQRRLSVLSPEGAFARSTPLHVEAPMGVPRPVAVAPDGRLLVTVVHGVDPAERENYVFRDSTPLLAYGNDGAPPDTLGVWPAQEGHVSTSRGSVIVGPAVWGRTTTFDVVGDWILIADSDRREVLLLDARGEPHRILRNRAPLRAVSSDDVGRYRARAEDPGIPERFRQRIRDMPLPETFPAHGDVVVGVEGDIWLAEFEPFPEGPRRWLVLGHDGPVAWASTPREIVRVFDVGRDFVLGLRFDELGVQQVVLLPLDGPAQ